MGINRQLTEINMLNLNDYSGAHCIWKRYQLQDEGRNVTV